MLIIDLVMDLLNALQKLQIVRPARITVKTLIKYRERKGPEWIDAFEGTFYFTCIDRETRKVYKLSKEEMDEIKK